MTDFLSDDESELMYPEENENIIVQGIDEDEEEVVFQAVEDEEEGVSGLDSFAGDDFDESEIYGTTILSDSPSTRAKDEQLLGEAQESEFADGTIAALSDYEESLAYIPPVDGKDVADKLTGVRNAILGIEDDLDGTGLSILHEELGRMRSEWLDRPAEKSYVQLLMTVAGNIERFGAEAGPHPGRLLQSIFDKMELCALEKEDTAQIQESLLAETSKVLEWQQGLLERSMPVVPRGESEKGAAEPTLSETSDEAEVPSLDDISKKVEALGEDILVEKVSSLMKSELLEIKRAFQEELKQLREDLLKKG